MITDFEFYANRLRHYPRRKGYTHRQVRIAANGVMALFGIKSTSTEEIARCLQAMLDRDAEFYDDVMEMVEGRELVDMRHERT